MDLKTRRARIRATLDHAIAFVLLRSPIEPVYRKVGNHRKATRPVWSPKQVEEVIEQMQEKGWLQVPTDLTEEEVVAAFRRHHTGREEGGL